MKRPFVILSLLAVVIAALIFAFNDNQTIRRTSVPPASVLGNPPAAPRTLSPLPVRTMTAEQKRLRLRSMDFVTRTRELPWEAEVGMTSLSGWEYGTRTREIAEVFGGDDLRTLGRLAAAGGVLPEGIDLPALAASFTAISAGASYSPFDKQILLVEREKKSDSLMAHELTHALQDQHFDLQRLLLHRPYNFDQSEAAFAVVEGDAVSVQRRFEQGAAWNRVPLERIGQTEDERFDDYRAGIGSFFPPLLLETFIFRYRDGVRFVEAVRRKNGQTAIDELLRRPPASSEQVLHPEKFFANEQPREAALDVRLLAAIGWRNVASSPLGEIGIRGVLLAGIPAKDATRAAAGWGGDRAYLFESRVNSSDETNNLFAWQTTWDTNEDANEFFDAYNRLLRDSRRAIEVRDLDADNLTKTVGWREGEIVTFVQQRGLDVRVLRGKEKSVREAAKALL